MKIGAIDFLVKPCSLDVLIAAIRQSLERNRLTLAREAESRDLRKPLRIVDPS
jgi:FixJ family two-component response regulator